MIVLNVVSFLSDEFMHAQSCRSLPNVMDKRSCVAPREAEVFLIDVEVPITNHVQHYGPTVFVIWVPLPVDPRTFRPLLGPGADGPASRFPMPATDTRDRAAAGFLELVSGRERRAESQTHRSAKCEKLVAGSALKRSNLITSSVTGPKYVSLAMIHWVGLTTI
jgi:hypothetical protein